MFLGSMLHSSDTAKISENPKSGRKIARVLVIYTGGTIGMKNDKESGKIFWFFIYLSSLGGSSLTKD